MQPEKLGPFQIGRILGRGGMGVVYEGIHEKTGESAAIKALISTLEDDSEIRLRFEAEIDTLKRLRHPNIVRLFGFGEEQDTLYYVMELVDGPSLHQEMRRHRLFQWHEVAKIGLEMCLALKHGHDRGITHRDIKPANILLERHGSLKLSDYGIAQFFGGQRLTEVNSVVGTLEYMSPEQSLANPVGPRSDIYSLGTVLYALLVGKPPYTARNLAEVVRKHQNGVVEPVRATRLDVPEDMEAIVLDLLRIKPEDRPQNTYLVAKRFQSLLQALVGPPERVLVKPMDADTPTMPPPASLRPPNKGEPNHADEGKIGRPRGFVAEGGVIDLGGIVSESEKKIDPKNIKLTIESGPGIGRTDAQGGSASIASSFGVFGSDLTPTRTLSIPGVPLPTDASRETAPDDDGFDIGATTALSNPEDENLPCPDSVGVENERPFSNVDRDHDIRHGEIILAPSPELHRSKDEPIPDITVFDLQEIQRRAAKAADIVKEERTSDLESAVPDRVDSPDFAGKPDASRDLPTVGGLEAIPDVMPLGAKDEVSESYALQSSATPTPATSSSGTATQQTKISRFVAVQEDELDDLDDRADRRSPVVSMQTIFASASLILIGLVVWYLLQPIPPEVLYDRIKETIESGRPSASEEESDEEIPPGVLRRAESDIRDFLKLYAGHPKADAVRLYEDKLEIANLERRLERRADPKTLSPPQRAYLEAIAKAKTDPEAAIVKLRALIDLFGSDAPFLPESFTTTSAEQKGDRTGMGKRPQKRLSGPTELCVELARRRLAQMEKNLATINAEQIALLEKRLSDADALEETHPGRAETIRRALIELYRDRPWAKNVVEKARSALKSKSSGD